MNFIQNILFFCSKKYSGVVIVAILVFGLNACLGNNYPTISIITDKTPGESVLHGLSKLTDVLKARNILFEKVKSIEEAKGDLIIVTGLANEGGAASQMLKSGNYDIPQVSEALTILKTYWQKKPVWVISGFDDNGLMYALLDVADRIGWSRDSKTPLIEVKEITEKPELSTRAISMYTMNRAYWESKFYNEDYWKRYLDMLSQNRFNSLVIIFGYENGGFLAPPYPYFFDVEEYPDIKMVGLTAEEQQRNLKTLNQLIDLSHERGIKVSVAIWDHIYRGGIQGMGIPGAEEAANQPTKGLVWGLNGDNLISYTRTALTRLVQLVPDLDGIEFRMHNESGLKRGEQEAFWADVFHSMKTVAPDMQFVLRAKDMPESVIQSALKEGIDFRIETKYWMEQMGLPFHPTHINKQNQHDRRQGYADMLYYPQDYKMYWRLWNGGTTRVLLWGNPDYARRFTQSAKLYDGDTYEITEPLATKMEAQPHDARPFNLLNPSYVYYDYEFERYWHFFQVFGRLGYNPETPSEVWEKEFEKRFGLQAGPVVEEVLHKASWVLPRIVASCYPYGGFPTTRGWAEKQRLGDLHEYANGGGTDIQQFASFDEEAQLLIENEESAKILPSMTSVWFKQTSDDINKLIEKAEQAIGQNRNKEFSSTVTDLKILSNLALYHSRRIPAAVSYRLFERTKDLSALEKAIKYEKEAIEAWIQIVESAGDVYSDNLMMGVSESYFDRLTHRLTGHWKDELGYLEEGLKSLEIQRLEFKAENSVVKTPEYKSATEADNRNLFQVNLDRIESAALGNPLIIKAWVSGNPGIKWVRLRYRSMNQKLDYSTLEMKPATEKDTYEATVPAEEIDPRFDFMYFIEVMSTNGKGKIYPDLNQETPYIMVKLKR